MVKKIFLSSFEKFFKLASKGGFLLFSASVFALIWANSSFNEYYFKLLQYKINFTVAGIELNKPLILWINDGLMSIFFFLIGLEIKREMIVGEINSLKKAALPIVAALGGILVPVLFFLLLNHNPDHLKGWGIPMATDIAFALAILSLLGKRVPIGLKIFLTALAIIDDLIAVLVIAIFYSGKIHWNYVVLGIVLIVSLGLFYQRKKYLFTPGIIIAIITWVLFLKSGIHPTIAGVLLAFTIPIKRRLNMKAFIGQLNTITHIALNQAVNNDKHLLSHDEIKCLENLNDLLEEVRSPLQYLEHKLHDLVGYFILPVFAFSNAGVRLDADQILDFSLILVISVSMAAGKFLGISLFSYLGVKLNFVSLPNGITFKHIFGVAAIAGV